MSRKQVHKNLARELGANWVGNRASEIPEKLDAAILFAPAGELVPEALESLDRKGILVVAGIYPSPIPSLNYQIHLYEDRVLRGVMANTRSDGREFLDLAASISIETSTVSYPLERAWEALRDLKYHRIRSAAVLCPEGGGYI